MATIYFLGTATAVANVQAGSIDSVDGTPANNTFTVTVGGVAISAVGDTDAATTATNLRASLNASTHPYFAAITWSGTAGDIIGTADTAGVPFVAALTETGAGTGSVTDFAQTTANSGPNDWSTATNWSGGAVPTAADTVYLRDNATNICWGLSQSAVTLPRLVIEKSFTGRIGLARTAFATSADGATTNSTKIEYREDYLSISATLLELGENNGPGNPAGSARVKIDLGANASTTTIFGTASASADSGLPAVRLLANHASTVIYVRSAPGGVGLATDAPGETSSVAAISISDVTTASKVFVGSGVTIGTKYEQLGGTNRLNAAATVPAILVKGGVLMTEGDYTITAIDQDAGTIYSNNIKTAGAAITTLNLNGGTCDGQGSNQPRTWTTVNIAPGGTLKGDSELLTITTLNETGGKYTLTAS